MPFYADERTRKALFDHPRATYRWHSVWCACEECLDADAVFCYYIAPLSRFDMEGITCE